MAWSWVQDTPGGNAATTNSAATSLQTGQFAAQPASGNFILAYFYGVNQSNTSTTLTCTDNAAVPNTYTQLFFFSEVNSGATVAVFVAKVNSLPASQKLNVQFTTTAGATQMIVSASEFSGGSTTKDVAAVGTTHGSGSVTSLAPGSMTTATDGDLIVTAVAINSQGNTITAPTGFTGAGKYQASGLGGYNGACAWEVQGTHGAVNPSWSWTVGAVDVAVGQVALKAAAGGGGVAWGWDAVAPDRPGDRTLVTPY